MVILLLILIWLAPSVSLNTSESHQPLNVLRGRLYAKTQGEKQEEKKQRSTPIPDAEQASHPQQIRWGRERTGKHFAPACRQARVLALLVRKQNLRGGYHSAYTGTQTKRQMYQTSNGGMSHGVCL